MHVFLSVAHFQNDKYIMILTSSSFKTRSLPRSVTLLILSGDVPLISLNTLNNLIKDDYNKLLITTLYEKARIH